MSIHHRLKLIGRDVRHAKGCVHLIAGHSGVRRNFLAGHNFSGGVPTNVLICTTLRLDLLEQFPCPTNGTIPNAGRHFHQFIVLGLLGIGRQCSGLVCHTTIDVKGHYDWVAAIFSDRLLSQDIVDVDHPNVVLTREGSK